MLLAVESESYTYFMKFKHSTLSGVMFCSSVYSVGVTFGILVKSSVSGTVELIALGTRIVGATGFCEVNCCIAGA